MIRFPRMLPTIALIVTVIVLACWVTVLMRGMDDIKWTAANALRYSFADFNRLVGSMISSPDPISAWDHDLLNASGNQDRYLTMLLHAHYGFLQRRLASDFSRELGDNGGIEYQAIRAAYGNTDNATFVDLLKELLTYRETMNDELVTLLRKTERIKSVQIDKLHQLFQDYWRFVEKTLGPVRR